MTPFSIAVARSNLRRQQFVDIHLHSYPAIDWLPVSYLPFLVQTNQEFGHMTVHSHALPPDLRAFHMTDKAFLWKFDRQPIECAADCSTYAIRLARVVDSPELGNSAR